MRRDKDRDVFHREPAPPVRAARGPGRIGAARVRPRVGIAGVANLPDAGEPARETPARQPPGPRVQQTAEAHRAPQGEVQAEDEHGHRPPGHHGRPVGLAAGPAPDARERCSCGQVPGAAAHSTAAAPHSHRLRVRRYRWPRRPAAERPAAAGVPPWVTRAGTSMRTAPRQPSGAGGRRGRGQLDRWAHGIRAPTDLLVDDRSEYVVQRPGGLEADEISR